jgi:hypothetical protein
MKIFGYCAIVHGFLFLLMTVLIVAGGGYSVYRLAVVSTLLISQDIRIIGAVTSFAGNWYGTLHRGDIDSRVRQSGPVRKATIFLSTTRTQDAETPPIENPAA